MVIVVSINALPLETVDTAEGVTDLRAFEDAFVVVIEVLILTGKHRCVHFGNGVNVLCDVTAQFYVELTELEDRLGVYIKFPTLVFECADIGGCQRAVTGAGGDTHAIVEQVGGCLFINVQVELEQVLKEVQLNADVPRLSLFPLNLRKAQVLRNDYLRAIVKRAVAGKLIIDKSFCIGRVTRDTPSRRYSEHAYHLLQRFEEFFIANIPTAGNTGEDTPLATRTETRATVGADSQVKYILRAKGIVNGARGTHCMPFAGSGPGVRVQIT